MLTILFKQTKQLISSLKMNGAVRAVAFSSDGSKMFSFGGKVFRSLILQVFNYLTPRMLSPTPISFASHTRISKCGHILF